ncbi:CapA family protein [Streptomyces armeniacus]|uniref:CapA family protein n=1 Tax=Streptomyces armeniacus TaxID=83291 RepID=A0A345XS46_9ACTN|nr:CapA family protein [Streptomyces armeniacus]AXK34462.1 CapA family protein [Streptomyces armeniacus]
MTRHVRTGVLLAAAVLLGTVTACGTDGSGGGTTGSEKGRGSAALAGDDARAFTLVATGDILAHDSIIRQARADAGGSGYDFRKMLAGAEPLASGADLAMCHMETVYGPDSGPFTGYPAFKTPPHVARAIKATGYDSCSTASNHTLDAGPEGVQRTLRAMDEAGLKHAGSARSSAERDRPAMLRAGGAKVAQLAYTYGTNGIDVPEDSPWLVNLIDPQRIIADARAARRAGADVVVVSVHWGDEWQEDPNKQQLSLAKQLTRSRTEGRRDIDLILGTHNHVPQAYEKVNGTWVVYGMGDQVAGEMNDPRGQMGSAARFTFVPPREEGSGWTVKKAEFVPFLMQTEPDHRLVNLNSPQTRRSGDPVHAGARDTIRDAVLSRGAASDGLTMAR